MSFVPGSAAAEELGGQPASRAQGGKGWGSCQGLFCSNRPLEHPPGAPPPHPTQGLPAALRGLGFPGYHLRAILPGNAIPLTPPSREDGDTNTASTEL